MCFGGSRKCVVRLQSSVPSLLHKYGQASCQDKKQYICKTCISEGKVFVSDERNIETFLKQNSEQFFIGKSRIDKNTCIDKSLDDICKIVKDGKDIQELDLTLIISRICSGCKLKMLCSHSIVECYIMARNIFASKTNAQISRQVFFRIKAFITIRELLRNTSAT